MQEIGTVPPTIRRLLGYQSRGLWMPVNRAGSDPPIRRPLGY
jgi:hypothetical protein